MAHKIIEQRKTTQATADITAAGVRARSFFGTNLGLNEKTAEREVLARADKDFARSDLIRDMLTAAGVAIEDTPHGPRWELKP